MSQVGKALVNCRGPMSRTPVVRKASRNDMSPSHTPAIRREIGFDLKVGFEAGVLDAKLDRCPF